MGRRTLTNYDWGAVIDVDGGGVIVWWRERCAGFYGVRWSWSWSWSGCG